MGQDQGLVRITAGDITAALALAEPEPDVGSKRMSTTLDLMREEPSGLGKLFKSRGVGLSVSVDPFMPGGPHHWYADVKFPRGLDLAQAFSQAGLEWPVWWVNDEVSHLIDKRSMKMLTVSGFGRAEYALPWFVRLHAVLAECDPFEPVFVRRSVEKVPDSIGDFRHAESHWDLMREVNESMRRDATDEQLKQEAYESWLVREDEWKRSGGRP
jgi:hypothetical protein